MNRVYDDDLGGGYTDEATELDKKVRNLLKDLIRKEFENGTPTEVIEYILTNAMHMEILAQKFYVRKDRRKHE